MEETKIAADESEVEDDSPRAPIFWEHAGAKLTGAAARGSAAAVKKAEAAKAFAIGAGGALSRRLRTSRTAVEDDESNGEAFVPHVLTVDKSGATATGSPTTLRRSATALRRSATSALRRSATTTTAAPANSLW